MILIYLLSTIILSSIYYLDLSSLHPNKVSNKKIYIILILGSITLAYINSLQSPNLNILASIVYIALISKFLFIHKTLRDYIPDLIMFLIIIFLDGLFFIIFHSIVEFFSIPNSEILLPICSSISLFFINLIVNKIFLKNDLYSLPMKNIILFFFIFVFHLGIINVLNFLISTSKAEFDFMMIALFIAVGLLLTDLLLFHYLNSIENSYRKEKTNFLKIKQNELSKQYYDNLKEKYNQQRKLIHDYNNHLQAVISTFENNKAYLAHNIIDEMQSKYSQSTLSINTSSDILNIILNDKIELSKKQSIQFDFSFDPSIDFSLISDMDIITLLGNILDNAIEANIKLQKERFISLKFFMANSMLILISRNNYDATLIYKNKRILSTKHNHKGLGLANIEETVEKYNGILEYKDDFGIFQLKIAIPIISQ